MADEFFRTLRKESHASAEKPKFVELHKKYGDHLYAKEDSDAAVTQYSQTIGRVEPSYVIRQLMQAGQIRNLAVYLEEIHKASLAEAVHTTLLLSCYSHMKASRRKIYDAFRMLSFAGCADERVLKDVDAYMCHFDTEQKVSLRGSNDNLWQEVLSKTCREDDALKTVCLNAEGSRLADLNDQVESLTSPIVALRMTAHMENKQFRSVKEFLLKALSKDAICLRKTCKDIHGLKRAVAKSRFQLQEMKRTPHIFQSSRCSKCGQALDLPAVHYFCMHNYHEGCNGASQLVLV